MADGHQAGSLARRQLARLANRKLAQLHRSELDTDQSLYPEAEGRAQAAHLAFASLSDGDLEFPAIAAEPTRLDALRMHRAVIQRDTLPRDVYGLLGLSENGGDVRALHFAARMRESMCRFAVRRQQQDTFGEVVQPSDVGQPGNVRQEIENSLAA